MRTRFCLAVILVSANWACGGQRVDLIDSLADGGNGGNEAGSGGAPGTSESGTDDKIDAHAGTGGSYAGTGGWNGGTGGWDTGPAGSGGDRRYCMTTGSRCEHGLVLLIECDNCGFYGCDGISDSHIPCGNETCVPSDGVCPAAGMPASCERTANTCVGGGLLTPECDPCTGSPSHACPPHEDIDCGDHRCVPFDGVCPDAGEPVTCPTGVSSCVDGVLVYKECDPCTGSPRLACPTVDGYVLCKDNKCVPSGSVCP